MPYIAREPAYGAFEKQSLTADGSTTTFSLDYTIGSTSSILVSVAGVHQEPEVAYNLGSGGTQIVFSTAPAATDTVFIVYLGIALDVATLPTNAFTDRTELSSAADDDLLLIYDTDAATIKKIQKSNVSANTGNIQVGITGANEIDTTSGNLTIDSAGGTVTVDDNLTVSGDLTVNGTTTSINSTTVDVVNSFRFEGATANDFETNLTVVDPTADRTITLPNATGQVVLRDTTDTLTNKTLTTPVISSISNTGTLTLPTSTDTLIGRATTDTLTNKTINSASNTITITESNISDLQSYILAGSTDTLTNKTINASNNTITNIGSSEAAADLITGQTELAEQAADGDFLLLYDTSATTLKKIQKSNIAATLTYNTRTATGNGSTTNYTVTSGMTVDTVLVTENGVLQAPTTDYTISGTTLTFGTAPASGVNIVIRELPV